MYPVRICQFHRPTSDLCCKLMNGRVARRFYGSTNLQAVWNLECIPDMTIYTQIHMALWQRVWSRRIASLIATVEFLSVSVFVLQLAHRWHRWTDFDDLYDIRCLFAQWRIFPFRGQIHKKPPKGAWIGVFQPNRQEIKMSYLRSCLSEHRVNFVNLNSVECTFVVIGV